eukprot:scaffold668_cov385-Prasinococcus_capsulatus_cf.AAC.22
MCARLAYSTVLGLANSSKRCAADCCPYGVLPERRRVILGLNVSSFSSWASISWTRRPLSGVRLRGLGRPVEFPGALGIGFEASGCKPSPCLFGTLLEDRRVLRLRRGLSMFTGSARTLPRPSDCCWRLLSTAGKGPLFALSYVDASWSPLVLIPTFAHAGWSVGCRLTVCRSGR